MSIPDFNSEGDLPEGVHIAMLDEVVARFGTSTFKRRIVAVRLKRIFQLAQATGFLERFIIYGSFITAKPEPNDVDVFLVMQDGFEGDNCDEETKKLFDHRQAHDEFGASVFWVCPSAILVFTLEDFIAQWQTKRDKTKRGIIEVQL